MTLVNDETGLKTLVKNLSVYKCLYLEFASEPHLVAVSGNDNICGEKGQ